MYCVKRVVSLKLRGSMYKSVKLMNVEKLCKKCLMLLSRFWASKKEDERKLQATEMSMLCMICGQTPRDGISNKTIC